MYMRIQHLLSMREPLKIAYTCLPARYFVHYKIYSRNRQKFIHAFTHTHIYRIAVIMPTYMYLLTYVY